MTSDLVNVFNSPYWSLVRVSKAKVERSHRLLWKHMPKKEIGQLGPSDWISDRPVWQLGIWTLFTSVLLIGSLSYLLYKKCTQWLWLYFIKMIAVGRSECTMLTWKLGDLRMYLSEFCAWCVLFMCALCHCGHVMIHTSGATTYWPKYYPYLGTEMWSLPEPELGLALENAIKEVFMNLGCMKGSFRILYWSGWDA